MDEKLIAIMMGALAEIAQGRGRFSMDQLTHASNTIEDMKEIAVNALAEVERQRSGK